MVLDPQTFAVPLLAGLQTKNDPKQLKADELTELQNATFGVPGRLTKRFGFDTLPIKLVSEQIQQGEALAAYNDELLLFTGTQAVSYAPAIDHWVSKGQAVSVIARKDPLLANANQQYLGTSLLFGDYEIYAYEEQKPDFTGINYTILDHSTKVRIIDNQVLDNAGSQPQIITIDGLIYFFYLTSSATSTNVVYKVLDPSTPFQLSHAVILVDDVDPAFANYDVLADGYVRVVYDKSDGYGEYVAYSHLNKTNLQSPLFNVSFGNPHNGLAVMTDVDGYTWVSYADPDKISAAVFNNAGSAVAPAQQIKQVPNVNRITMHPHGKGVRVYYELTPDDTSDAGNYFIEKTNLSLSNGHISAKATESYKRSVGLYSKPFKIGDIYYLVVQHISTLQSCYFVIDENSNIIARLMYGEGASSLSTSLKSLCQVSLDSGVVFFPAINLGFQNALIGLSRLSLDFVNNNSFIGYTAAGTHNIVGGVVQSYDNTQFVENNFLLYPEDSVGERGTGGNVTAGTYLYKFVFSSTNNLKKIEYSTTSIPLGVTVGADNSRVILTVPSLRLTLKDQVMVQVYRTEAGQSTLYYLIGETLNDATADTVQIIDTTSDADLIDNLPLYTTGGILDNFSPPSCNLMAICNNRCFIAGLENRNQINYSKEITPGLPLEFAEEFQIISDTAGGDITALGEIDGKLIIFKENSLFYIQGSGPNAFGQNDDFGPPQLISSDVGCISANSVCKMDLGLMFQTAKGIYLLDRANSVNPYIGSPVAVYNNLVVTSAKLMEKFNEIRFTTSENILVYNYFVNKWSVTTSEILKDITDSEFWQNQYVVLDSRGYVKQENLNSKLDDGKFVQMKVSTSWINPSGTIQGVERFWRMAFIGNYYTPHNINVECAFNYEPFVSQNWSVDARTLVSAPPVYNQGKYSDGVYNGGWYPYQARLSLSRQSQIQAIKITIYDTPIEGVTPGESYDLSAITLELGIAKGIVKLRPAASFNTTG